LQKYPLCDLLTPLSPAISRRSCNHRITEWCLWHIYTFFQLFPNQTFWLFSEILQVYRCLETEFLSLCIRLHFHGKCTNWLQCWSLTCTLAWQLGLGEWFANFNLSPLRHASSTYCKSNPTTISQTSPPKLQFLQNWRILRRF
jgi:hypothetical protein